MATQKMDGNIQRLLAVVVVYRQRWSEIAAANYLLKQLEMTANAEQVGMRFRFRIDRLIIYDNSPNPMAMQPHQHERIDYKHNPENGGTRSAYDYALAEAIVTGQEWILLLDQDTFLPDNFLISVGYSFKDRSLDEIDVLLPRVEDQGRYISPAYITLFGSVAPITESTLTTDVFGRIGLTGIASGSMIRITALHRIPQLPSQLWLDYVDHWIFHQLNLIGARVLLVNTTLQHKLSLLTMSEVSTQRLHSILDGERLFTGSLGLIAKLIYPIRLWLRLVRLTLTCPSAAKKMISWLWLRFVR